MLNNFFKSPYWSPKNDSQIQVAYSLLKTDTSFWGFLSLPWATVVDNQKYRTVIGPIFLIMLPVYAWLVITLKGRAGYLLRLLSFYSIIWVVLWFLSGALEIRYGVALFPVTAILVAYPIVVNNWPSWAGHIFKAGLFAILLAVTVMNTPQLVYFQKHSTVPGSYARTIIAWEFLYRNQSEENVQLVYAPLIQYINRNLSPYNDKVYDYNQLILFNSYSNIEIFNGHGLESPTKLGYWNLSSPDALQRLKGQNITHVAANLNRLSVIQSSAIWPHLKEIYRNEATNDILFKVMY